MKSLVNLFAFLAWVAIYLSAVTWAARYRRDRTRVLTIPASSHYRADQDLGLKLLLLVFGLLSFGVVYYLNRVLG